MTVLITDKSVNLIDTAIGISVHGQLPDGCVYLNFYSGQKSNLSRNLIPGSKKPLVVGNPVIIQDGFTRFSASQDFIRTGIEQKRNMTFFFVYRTSADITRRSYLISNNTSAPSTGGDQSSGVSLFSNERLRLFLTTNDTFDNAATIPATASTVCTAGARYGDGLWGDLFTFGPNGQRSELPPMKGKVVKLGGELLIGSPYVTAFAGHTADIAAAAIFDNRVASFTQIYAYFKDMLSGRIEI